MECYIYRILNEQVLVKEGYLYASNSISAVRKFQKEILPKFQHYTFVEFKEAACSSCQTTDRVVAFKIEESTHLMCRTCHHNMLKKKKAACAATQTA